MALADKDFPAVIRTLMPKLVMEKRTGDLSGPITEMALGCGKEAFLRQERAIIGRIDSRAHLAAIECHTLVVAARHDALMPVELLEELARCNAWGRRRPAAWGELGGGKSDQRGAHAKRRTSCWCTSDPSSR